MSASRFWTSTNPEILITGGGGRGKDKDKKSGGGGRGGGWTGRGGGGWGKGGGGPGVPLDFPTVIGISSRNSGTTNVTVHDVTVPAHSNGDGLIVLLQTTGIVDAVPTNPTGFGDPAWIDVTSMANADWRTMLYCWFKISDGTQTDFTITTANSRADLTSCIAVRNFTGVPVVSAISAVRVSNPNPPNLITGFGAVKTLFFAIAGQSTNIGQNFEGTYPTGYTANQDTDGLNNSCQYAMATLEVDGASEDPPAYGNWGFSRDRWAYTMALKGA